MGHRRLGRVAVGRPFGTLRSASRGAGPWGCGSFALCAWAVLAAGARRTGGWGWCNFKAVWNPILLWGNDLGLSHSQTETIRDYSSIHRLEGPCDLK